jgi:hypothetical protein
MAVPDFIDHCHLPAPGGAVQLEFIMTRFQAGLAALVVVGTCGFETGAGGHDDHRKVAITRDDAVTPRNDRVQATASIETTPPEEQRPPSDDETLYTLLISSLDSNDEKLGAIKAAVRRVTENRMAREAKTVTVKSPDGAIAATYRRSPISEYRYYIVFCDKCFKYTLDMIGDDGRSSQSWAYDGKAWTQYDPTKKLAQIRRSDQMGSFFPYDPREMVMDDVRLPLRRFLRMSKIKRLREDDLAARARHGMLRAEWTDREGQRLTVDFDPAYGTLPVASVSYRPDGSILASTRVFYRRVSMKDAFILDNAVTRFFPEKTRSIDVAWSKSMVTTLMDVGLIDEKVGREAATLRLPKNVRVKDFTSDVPAPAAPISQ